MSCKHATFAPDSVLKHIHDVIHKDAEAEFGAGRQKCAAAAYERGFDIGKSGKMLPHGNEECPVTKRRAPREMLNDLPKCQADTSRHTCCVCAYHEGFERGQAMAVGQLG